MSTLLETRGLGKRFRNLVANDDIDFVIDTGAIHCVIGPNGAGKTTFISMISGHLQPTKGQIFYRGEDVTKLSVVDRARRGIARKFQTPSVFHGLTAYANIELAALRVPRNNSERNRRVLQVLDTVRLGHEQNTPVAHLSHGQRQWLEIGMLLAMEAQLFLLDEPAAGMTAEETAATTELMHTLVDELGIAVIVIEHDMNFIRRLSAEVTVLHLGRVLATGSFAEIADNERVIDVYLGKQI